MLPPSPVAEGQARYAPSQLEELIGWRRLQLQALHRLRLQLAAIPDRAAAEVHACRSMPSHDVPRLLVRVGDIEVTLDTRFLERPELLALERLLSAPADADPALAPSLRLRLAARIDELNQLNRCSFEVLRIFESCRRGPPPA